MWKIEERKTRLIGNPLGSYWRESQGQDGENQKENNSNLKFVNSKPQRVIFKRLMHLKDLAVVPVVFLEVQGKFLEE